MRIGHGMAACHGSHKESNLSVSFLSVNFEFDLVRVSYVSLVLFISSLSELSVYHVSFAADVAFFFFGL